MCAQHIEMTFIHRDVGGLANRAARVVNPLRHVSELYEFLEVLDRRIATPAFGVADKWRAIDRRENKGVAPDLDRPLGVTGMLGEARRRRLAERPRQSLGQPHTLAVDIGARVFPERQSLGVIDEVDADLFEHRLGIRLDDRERLFVQDVEIRDIPLNKARRLDADGSPFRPARRTTATAACPPSFPHIAHECLPSKVLRRNTRGRTGIPDGLRRLKRENDMGRGGWFVLVPCRILHDACRSPDLGLISAHDQRLP